MEDGDIIEYNISEGRIELMVSDEVLEERKKHWNKPEPKVKSGVLAIYGATCRQANEGAAMQNW